MRSTVELLSNQGLTKFEEAKSGSSIAIAVP
jgi:hypothetical protein